jgi:hypothetical protein
MGPGPPGRDDLGLDHHLCRAGSRRRQPGYLSLAGLIFLLEIVIRLVIRTYRRPVGGRLVLAFIALAIGVGGYIGWELTWPLILVGVGLAIIVGVFLRPRF